MNILKIIEEGDWKAGWRPEYIVTYEELSKKDGSGKDMFEKANQVGCFFDNVTPIYHKYFKNS